MDTADQHLISHSFLTQVQTTDITNSFLTTSNWILPVHTHRSLPPLRPCLTSHFRQGWSCECTFRLAPSDLGFAGPRIIPTNPSSRAAVCFAINFTTSSSGDDPFWDDPNFPSYSIMPMPTSSPICIVYESLFYSPHRCARAGLTPNCPTLGIPHPRYLLSLDPWF